MSIIVTDQRVSQPHHRRQCECKSSRCDDRSAVRLQSRQQITPELMQARCIRIELPSFADGRGFTLATMLRERGYHGHLRAFGHVLADQYAMARRSGFDDVQISDELATRQPEAQWQYRADWRAHDYQARLRQPAA